MMEKLRWIWVLPFIILAIFGIIFFILYRQPSSLDKSEDLTREVRSPEMETRVSDPLLSSQIDQTARVNQGPGASVHPTSEISESAPPPTDDSATDPMLEIIAPLIEGVDSLTAAKGLKREGFFDYAREYARKAVAENPESFEALLLLAQLLLHDGNEREATFRRLVGMDSTSVEVLYRLGQTLSRSKPAEAIPYLKAAIAAEPLHGSAYSSLGRSYERLGMYNEALAAYKKSCELPPPGFDIRRWHPEVSLIHIRAIEAGNPILKPIQREPQQQLPEETVPEESPFEMPSQEETPPIPNAPSGLERETGFDNEPGDFTLPRESREATPAEQQTVEKLIRIIEAYEASISSKIPTEDENSSSQSLSKVVNGIGKQESRTRIESAHSHPSLPVGSSYIGALSVPDNKAKRIREFYDSLTEADWEGLDRWGPHPKEFEILTEGMDAFSAAEYLKALGHSKHASKYAERALAENPDSFEVLLLWCQLRPPEQATEREAGFRKLLAMNPNSVDALIGLGTRLAFDGRPDETLGYLEKASLLDPERPPSILGLTYELLGQYDKALVTLKQSYKITHSPVELSHIRAIEAGTPLWKPIQREPLGQPPESSSPETSSESPPPTTPSSLERETGFDNEPEDFTPSRENGEATPAEQQTVEELIRIIEAYEASISSKSDPSAVVEGGTTDVERSIESQPNRAESYLEWARAYKETGEDEKAAEVYRRAREHFPDSKRIQRESEAFEAGRDRPSERSDEEED